MAGENEITGILNLYLSQISSDLKDMIQRKPVTKYGVVNASGKLKDSVRQDIKNAVGRVYALDYIYYLEKGRKPGKRPPTKAIEAWIESKESFKNSSGWNTLKQYEKNSLVYLIQRKIGLDGTTIYQQGGSTLVADILTDELKGQIQSQLILTFRSKTNALMRSAITGK